MFLKEYNEIIEKGKPHLLVDVRPKIQYDICHLPNSLHIPIEELPKEMHKVKEAMKEQNVTDKDGTTTNLNTVFIVLKNEIFSVSARGGVS